MSAEQIQEVAIERIKTEPQIRKQFDSRIVEGIAASLLECGQLQPIRVRRSGDDLVIADGELRFRAGNLARLKTMNVIIEANDLCEGEVIHRQLVSNCNRSNLNDIEKAQAIDALKKHTGWNATQTAAKLGWSGGTVTKALSLLKLSEALQQRVRDGEIPTSAAYALTKVQEGSEQEKLAERVASGELTRDELSRAIKEKRKGRKISRKPRPLRVTAKLENGQTVSVAGTSLDLNSFVVILNNLLSHAQQALNDGLTLELLLKRLATARRQAQATNQAA